MSEDGVHTSTAICVVKMAGADELYRKNNPIFTLLHSTIAAPTNGLDRFKYVAVMIPSDEPCAFIDMDTDRAACRFVHVHARLSVPQPDGRCRIQNLAKNLEYGNVTKKKPSIVSIVLDEDDAKKGNVVIKLTSNHSGDCLFTIVAKCPGRLDHHMEAMLGASRLWDVTDDTKMSAKEWYWHFFMTSGMMGIQNDDGYVFSRDTVWEVSTVIKGTNTRVFDIAFRQNNES